VLTLLRQKVNSLVGRNGSESDPEPADTEEPSRPSGALIHKCPDCGTVYLSESPRECTSCREQTVPTSSSGGE